MDPAVRERHRGGEAPPPLSEAPSTQHHVTAPVAGEDGFPGGRVLVFEESDHHGHDCLGWGRSASSGRARRRFLRSWRARGRAARGRRSRRPLRRGRRGGPASRPCPRQGGGRRRRPARRRGGSTSHRTSSHHRSHRRRWPAAARAERRDRAVRSGLGRSVGARSAPVAGRSGLHGVRCGRRRRLVGRGEGVARREDGRDR